MWSELLPLAADLAWPFALALAWVIGELIAGMRPIACNECGGSRIYVS